MQRHKAAQQLDAHPHTLQAPCNSWCVLLPGVFCCRVCSAAGFANNAAVAFEVQLQQSFAPLVAMAAMIHVQPYYPALAKQFDAIAAELIAQVCSSRAMRRMQ